MLWEFPLNDILKIYVYYINHWIVPREYFSESFGENVANLSIFHLQISQGLMESGLAMAGQGNSEEFPLFRENKR